MTTKNFYLAGLLSFLFCAGLVEASKQPSVRTMKQPIDDFLEKDRNHFIQKMQQSKYYDLQKSREDAGDDYLYLAHLLSQWGMDTTIGNVSVQDLTAQWVGTLKDPQKPWEKLLVSIAKKYVDKKEGKLKGTHAIFKHSFLEELIAQYNLMSFAGCKTIQSKGVDGKYRLLNDWGSLLFHCNEEAFAYDKCDRITKRDKELGKDDELMEKDHNYVQIWYPIFSVSLHHDDAPRMSPVLYEAIKENPTLDNIYVNSIKSLFGRTLDFMGLEYDPKNQKISKNKKKIDQHINWIVKDHNFWRINRYLQALSIVGMNEEKNALLNYLKSGPGNGEKDWQQFCDNDKRAISKRDTYQDSLKNYWSLAEAENAGYVAQVKDSLRLVVRSPDTIAAPKPQHTNTKQSIADEATTQPDTSFASTQKIRKKKRREKRQRTGLEKRQRRRVTKNSRTSRKTRSNRKKTMRSRNRR